jgi:polyisoprenoid-binding protein YceI
VTRRTRLVLAAAAMAVLLLGGGAVTFFLLRNDGPDAATTEDAVAVLDDRPAQQASSGPQPVDGEWLVDSSIGVTEYPFDDGSYVGYRVQEELAGIGGNTVVGRTPGVGGTLTIAGTQITGVSVVADFGQLQSDNSGRDRSLRDQAIETDTFPEASFTLTAPIELGSIPVAGETITVDATGELTLHGVAKPITIRLEATLVDDTIAVVGRAPITFADYDIETPTAALVVGIDEIGELELQLFFARAETAPAG